MAKVQQGYSLIEIMVAITIVGVLAAIGIRAYQDFVIRARVTSLITAAGACKVAVSEYHQVTGDFPGPTNAGCSTTGTENYGPPTVAEFTGVIIVTAIGTLANQLEGNDSGTELHYGPVLSGDAGSAIVGWDCQTGTTIADKYLPAPCRHGSGTASSGASSSASGDTSSGSSSSASSGASSDTSGSASSDTSSGASSSDNTCDSKGKGQAKGKAKGKNCD